MNTHAEAEAPDYRIATEGTITVTEAGEAVCRAYRDAERAFGALQHCWVGAYLAGIFLRHPWLQSMRATLTASFEYDDQGETYRLISNSVVQVLPVGGAALPESARHDGEFDELGAIAMIEADLDENDLDLYTSIRTDAHDCDDVELDLSRDAIAALLNGGSTSGAQAYAAWFPESPPEAAAC